LKFEDFYILSTKKNNLALHDFKKLRKSKDENIILGVGKKARVSFFFLVATLFCSFSFFLYDGKTLLPTFLLVHLYPKKKI
jgi:hypothetical protein